MTTHSPSRPHHFLSQVDTRIKLPFILALVVLCFGSTTWISLAIATFGTAVLFVFSGNPVGFAWRTCWALRWLLLFTFLVHLLFSSGHVLLGSRFLFRDGFMEGLFVSCQLTLAILTASILCQSTSTDQLVNAFGWFLLPLKRLKCPVESWQQQIFLVLKLLPVVRKEYLNHQNTAVTKNKRIAKFSLRQWVTRITLTLDRLLVCADDMAHGIVAGTEHFSFGKNFPPLNPWSLHNWCFGGGILILWILFVLAQ